MQYPRIMTCLVIFLLSASAQAGVVMDMVTRDSAGQETGRAKVYAQSDLIRMDQGGGDGQASMIFLGDRFLYVDHKDKSYVVMDEAMLDDVSAKISDAMKEMQEQMASMPPEQRAMVEQMMKGKMDEMMGQQGAAGPEPRVESMGSGTWQSYACRQFAVFEGTQKTQQICAASLEDVAGAEELMQAFVGMAAYIRKMTESLPVMPKDGLNPGELMEQIDGFPVHTIDYRDGKILRQMSMESLSEQELGEDLFAAPEGYRHKDPFTRR